MPRKTSDLRHDGRVVGASMRPRPDAAENVTNAYIGALSTIASMRPRPDAAENSRLARNDDDPDRRFNEAAARCRGKHSIPAPWSELRMRLQ